MTATATAAAFNYLLSGDDPARARELDQALRIAALRIGLRLGQSDIAEAQFDGFVRCTECGRDVADHTDGALDGVCGVRFDEQQIGDLREAYGLTREPGPAT